MEEVSIVFFLGGEPKAAITLRVPNRRGAEVLDVIHESTLNGLRHIGAADVTECK